MKYKSLRIAIIAGQVAKVGQELELDEKVARSFVEAGFLEEVKHNDSEQAIDATLKSLSEFKTKEELEAYGKEFGINLNRSKTLENMYLDLKGHVETK